LGLGIKIFGFWVLGLGFGFGYKVFWVLGIIPNPIPQTQNPIFSGYKRLVVMKTTKIIAFYERYFKINLRPGGTQKISLLHKAGLTK